MNDIFRKYHKPVIFKIEGCGKIAYPSRGIAKKILKNLITKEKFRNSQTIHVYKCDKCDFYHLGNRNEQ